MYKKLFFFLLLPVLGISQTQIGLDIDGKTSGDRSGTSVSLSADGNIVAIGAPDTICTTCPSGTSTGYVSIYENISGIWVQIGGDIYGIKNNEAFGHSVSLSADGSIVAVSAFQQGVAGSVRVYQNISGTWTQIGDNIYGEQSGDWTGYSISLSADGDVIAIGAPSNHGNGGLGNGYTLSGSVKVYKNISGIWTQIGDDIDGEAAGDASGWSISLSSDGSIIAIGAHLNKANGIGAGHVRIYENVSGIWTQIGDDIDGEAAGDQSGESVSLSSDGTIVAIGAPNNSGNGAYSGHVRVYENIAGVWTQIGQDIEGESPGDNSGRSVSLSLNGTVVAIGALNNSGNGTHSGHVRIYENISGTWTQIGQDIDGEAANDYSGSSIFISPNNGVIAIGASGNGDNGYNSGHVRVYDISGILSTNNFISESFDVYPNPVSDVLNIHMKNNLSLEKVTIYNNSGQIVKESKEFVLNVSNLSKGIYFVEVTTNQGKAVKKVVVK